MPQELSTIEIGAEGIELSVPTRARLLEESHKLLHHSHLREWQGLMMRAAAFWNIKTKRLFLAGDCQSFEEYTSALGYTNRQRQHYERIGQRMFESAFAAAQERDEPIDPMTFVFTQKLIAEQFEGFFTNGHIVTMRGLAQASANLQSFTAYLRGEEVKEDHAIKCLEESNIVSEKRLEDTTRERISTTKDFHSHMREIAKEKGLKWNKEKFCFENIDGSPLREDQRVELTTRESGLYVWQQSFKELRQSKKRLATIASNFGESYALYDRVPDTNFHTIVTEIAQSMRNEIESYEEMLECLLAKDFTRMEELAKVRADEEVNG